MPTARWLLAAGVLNGLLYAVGGSSDPSYGTPLASVEAFDGSSWQSVASMPTARMGLAVGVAGGTLYAFGGATMALGYPQMDNVEAFDGSSWSTVAPMPTARYMPAAGVLNGILFAIGGRVADASGSNPIPTASVEAFNGIAWQSFDSMPTMVHYPAVAVGGEMLYVLGDEAVAIPGATEGATLSGNMTIQALAVPSPPRAPPPAPTLPPSPPLLTSLPPSPPLTEDSSGLPAGAIIGIAVGAGVLVIGAFCILVYCMRSSGSKENNKVSA